MSIKLRMLKKKGFSDKAIADFVQCSPIDIYKKRKELNIQAVFKMVDTCGGEFEAISPYYYSTYDEFDEVQVSDKKKSVGYWFRSHTYRTGNRV